MKFVMIVKDGLTIKAEIAGRARAVAAREALDLDPEKIIEVEQQLERWFGLRFHIFARND